jgi:hypothetical protein
LPLLVGWGASTVASGGKWIGKVHRYVDSVPTAFLTQMRTVKSASQRTGAAGRVAQRRAGQQRCAAARGRSSYPMRGWCALVTTAM